MSLLHASGLLVERAQNMTRFECPQTDCLDASKSLWLHVLRALIARGLIVVTAACQMVPPEPKRSIEHKAGIPVRADCPPASSPDYFYPDQVLPDFNLSDRSIRDVHSKFLKAAGLPSLSCGGGEIESYRVLWIASARPSIIASATWSGSHWNVAGFEFIDPRSQPLTPDRLLDWTVESKVTKSMSANAAHPFVAARRATSLWSMPAKQLEAGAPTSGVWIVEATAEGVYRVIVRDYARDAPLQMVGVELVKLAGMAVPDAMKDRGFWQVTAIRPQQDRLSPLGVRTC
jgi:hypothetical protein